MTLDKEMRCLDDRPPASRQSTIKLLTDLRLQDFSSGAFEFTEMSQS